MAIRETPTGLVKAAVEHLLKQEVPSYSRYAEGNQVALCMYRDEQGNACAIGGLIPDEKYDEELESGTLYNVLRVIYGRLPHSDVVIAAGKIQRVHDKWATFWSGLSKDRNQVGDALSDLDDHVPGWREELGKEMESRFLALLQTRQAT